MLGDDRADVPVRPVVHALAFLVLDHLFFVLQGPLGDGVDHETQAVRVDPHQLFERVLRHHLVVDGAVRPRAAVARAAELADHLAVGPARDGLRVVERHVLEEVSETPPPRALATGADVDQRGEGHDRVGRVLVQNHVQPVVQRVFDEGNLEGARRAAAGLAGNQQRERYQTQENPA